MDTTRVVPATTITLPPHTRAVIAVALKGFIDEHREMVARTAPLHFDLAARLARNLRHAEHAYRSVHGCSDAHLPACYRDPMASARYYATRVAS